MRRFSTLLTVLPAVIGALSLQPLAVEAQEVRRDTTAQGLKRMTVDDFALWRSVGQTSLSPDGRWVTFAYSQREVDDSLFIKPLAGGESHVVVRGSNPTFTGDSRWVAYYVNPKEEEGGRSGSGGSSSAGRGQGGGNGQARSLELFDLESRDTVRWENVQAFAFAESGAALAVKKRKADSDADHDGTDLLVRYLSSGEEELISYVDEWGFDKAGHRLAYTLATPDGESNGIHLLNLDARTRQVLDAERKMDYARLSWGDDKGDPSADALAVLKGGEDNVLVETVTALLMWPALSSSVEPVILDPRPVKGDTPTEGSSEGGEAQDESGADTDPGLLPEGWVLSEKGALDWAKEADRILSLIHI